MGEQQADEADRDDGVEGDDVASCDPREEGEEEGVYRVAGRAVQL